MRSWRSLPALLVGSTLLASCGGDPTGGAAVATVEVSLPTGMLIGDVVTATVTLRDGSGNILTGRTITFALIAGPTISVDAAGLVTALAAGGPITVSASAGGRTGTATVTVRDDQRIGYAWADNNASASYTPSATYSFNSSGGTITATRSGTGVYSVRFAGLARADGQRENVQVTAYSDPAYCNIAGWQNEGADLVVNILCFATTTGSAIDSYYTVFVAGARVLAGRVGFVLANQASTASYSPADFYNSAHGPVTITRSGPGTYQVRLTGLNRGATSGPEMVMVTEVGSGGTGSNRCVVEGWDYDGFDAYINCTDRNGIDADAQFSLLIMERGRTGQRTGFAWAHDAAGVNYTPSTQYSHNSSGGTVTATRVSVGTYRVTWEGLVKGAGTETVLISAYGNAQRWCRTSFWGMATPTAFQVTLSCFDPGGALADAQFDIVTIQ